MNDLEPAALAAGNRAGADEYSVRTVSFAYCFLVIAWCCSRAPVRAARLGPARAAVPHLSAARRPARVHLGGSAPCGNPQPVRRFARAGRLGAMLGFSHLDRVAALFSTLLNAAIMRGLGRRGSAAVCFAGGALAWVAPMGFMHYRHQRPGDGMCFFGSLAYSAGVGLVVRTRTGACATRREDARRRAALPADHEHAADLVAMSTATASGAMPAPRTAASSRARTSASADGVPRLHEEDQFRVRAVLQGLMQNACPPRLRMRLHTRHGDVRRVESLLAAVRGEDGEITARCSPRATSPSSPTARSSSRSPASPSSAWPRR